MLTVAPSRDLTVRAVPSSASTVPRTRTGVWALAVPTAISAPHTSAPIIVIRTSRMIPSFEARAGNGRRCRVIPTIAPVGRYPPSQPSPTRGEGVTLVVADRAAGALGAAAV